MTVNKIPAPIIGLLAEYFPQQYTHDIINNLFLTAGAPEDIPEGSKPTKVQSWLRDINKKAEQPLEVLGQLLEGFMDSEPPTSGHYLGNYYSTPDKVEAAVELARKRIRDALAKDGLQYLRGGRISFGQGTPTGSLLAQIKQRGLTAVDVEFRRALESVDKDPPAACLAAGTILESVCKVYLGEEEYLEKDTLWDLWNKTAQKVGLRPRELEDKDLKKIVTGLFSIIDGIMNLRNKKSSSHGKSDEQIKTYVIESRHARLAVHSAHTIAIYILEVSSKKIAA